MKSKIILLHICLIVSITAACFYPVLFNKFISIDDGRMLFHNEKVFSLTYANIVRCFTEFHWGLYHPLVLVSYAIEFNYFKFNPLIYHTTNLYLHIFNCLLVYWLFLLLTENKWKAFLVAVLFGVHPIHVESVAWISERKDVLYSFFYLGAAVSYIYYLKNNKNYKYYFAALLLFVLSLLSKPTAVTFPLLLLLFDHMKVGRVDLESIKEKAPFFVFALIFAALALFGQNSRQIVNEPIFMTAARHFFEANYNIMLYFYKTLAPLKYTLYYSNFIEGSSLIKGFIWYSPFALALIASVIIYSAKYTKKGVYGALLFSITLLPASNLMAFGINIPGLRHMYIPILGILYIFVEALAWIIQKLKGKKLIRICVLTAMSVLVCMLSITTNARCRQWKDTFTLCNGIVKDYPDTVNSKYAYNLLANCYLDKGDVANALKYSEKAHQLDNSFSDYYLFKSLLAYSRQDYAAALGDINEAVSKSKPGEKYIYLFFKASVLCKLKYYDQALICADGLAENKLFVSLGYQLKGKIFYENGNYGSAVSESTKAIEMNCFDADAYTVRFLSYKKLGKNDEAMQDFKKLSKIETSYVLMQ